MIESGDFGGATSANSLKVIHGGLRHLQRASLRLVREGVRARRRMMALFPGVVEPLPCVVPTYGFGTRGRFALGVALALNDLLSLDRNDGLAETSRLPRGRILGRDEMLRLAPGLETAGLTGGALWYDAIATDTERLVLDLVLAAAAHGACAANYVRAEGFLRRGDTVAGVRARDVVSGAEFEVRARVTLNAAGPWLDLLQEPFVGPGQGLPLTKAVNVLVGRALFGKAAVGLAGGGSAGGGAKRFFFFVPWRGGTMIGTLYLPFSGAPETCAVSATDIALMVSEVNRVHPASRLTADEVRFAHVGLMPVARGTAPQELDTGLLREPLVLDGAHVAKVEGLIGIRSVKYTSACSVADDALRLVLRKLGRSAPARLPTTEPVALAAGVPLPRNLGAGPPEAACTAELSRRLRALYGTASDAILDIVRLSPGLARRVTPDQPTIGAELVHAIRAEAALTLGDLVLRRTPLGSFGHPGGAVLARCAAIAGDELGWDTDRREREVELVDSEYRRLGWRG